ncbi:hypothetical protein [Protaetiibacter intestinalis]|uniref:Integral membrane protein n=1 Tax=Protaetiibacter intestinalis TaxID=2419774 RepID=A0A387B1I3_9MICO|nr:hypothetical protein [Protaetiibacter intestinalis]AYF97382.1 hypothetical protein D7I47_03355 [Protaetiibacter intestinalis]
MTDNDRSSARTAQGVRWPRWVFRVTSTASAVMLFDQAIFAGQFLDGTYGSLHQHRENATYAGISVLISAVAAVLVRWPGGGPWWPILASLGIFGMIAAQIALGFARLVAIHVPLGVATIGIAILLAVWAWRRP